MRRRDFIKIIAAGAAAGPLTAHAQQGERVRRIGIIMQMAESDPQAQLNVQALQKGLRERGLNEGQDLRINMRFGATLLRHYELR